MNQRVGLMPSTAPRRVHLAGVSQMGRSFRHGVCAYSPETYSRLLAELHHSRAARIRVAGGGAGGDAPDAQASALGLPYGQPQPPKRLSPSWDTTNHRGVQREVSSNPGAFWRREWTALAGDKERTGTAADGHPARTPRATGVQCLRPRGSGQRLDGDERGKKMDLSDRIVRPVTY